MLGVVLILGVLTLIYYLVTQPYKYWAKKNVPTGKIVPVFGDNLPICLGKESPAEMIQRMYNKLDGVRYLGAYQFHIPVFIPKCPELIKQMCVKDSDHTLDHGDLILSSGDELWSKSLVSLKGQHWKDMRAIVSPAFTGNKLKAMFSSVCDHAKAFSQHFLDKNKDYVEGEFRDAYTRYCSDCIAHNAFGVQVDSIKDRDNLFYTMAFDSCDFTIPWKKIVMFIFQLFPKISRTLGLSVFGKEVKFYFTNLVRDTIKVRQEHKIKRPDLVGLLMEAREEEKRESSEKKLQQEETSSLRALKQKLTNDDIASQAFVIFVGAFETGSITMCFMAYELATHSDCQKKLIEEIDNCCAENEEPSYEAIMNLPYLDMVVSEVLRKWPGAVGITRVVTKPYTIQPQFPHEKPVHLEKGVNITIPVFGLHRDPKYFENPEKFDPERFSPENKDKMNPNAYLPFGTGPRYCIGSRYGLLTVKSVFFFLLQNFEIVPTEKTQIPLVISKNSMNLTSENGFPLGLRRRAK